MILTIFHMSTPAVTTLISSMCLECGIIPKSGKMSCCGHGGSWFGNCRNAGNANFGHTWHEGIRVCKSQQSQIAVDQQIHAPNPKNNASSGHASMGVNSEKVVVTTRIFASKPTATSTPMLGEKLITVSVNTSITLMTTASDDMFTIAGASITMRDYGNFFHVVTCINMIFVACW